MEIKEARVEIYNWVKTDKYNLEEEWEKLPERVCIISDLFVELRNKADILKWEAEREEAETYADIKANTGAYGIDKFTESAAKQVILLQDGVKKRKGEYIHALKESREAEGWMKSLDVKRKALELLVQLYSTQYFSEPKERPGTEEGIRVVRERRVNSKVSSKLNPEKEN